MANQINDGGAAFPIPLDERPGAYPAEPGMSLRDYFAAKAMQALIARVPYDEPRGMFHGPLSVAAFMMADEMLKARHD